MGAGLRPASSAFVVHTRDVGRGETSTTVTPRTRQSAAQAVPAVQHNAGKRVPATYGDLE